MSRGSHPDDARLFGEDALGHMRAAAEEIAWLLDRGYPPRTVNDFVGGHHQLESRQRLALQRGVCSPAQYQRRAARELDPEDVARRPLVVDGFNLIITIEVALSGFRTFRQEDVRVETGVTIRLDVPLTLGNVSETVTVNAGTTVTKRLELLRELVPSLKQVAVLTHPGHPTDPVQRKEMEEAARALGLQLKPAAVRALEDFEAAFNTVSGAGGLLNIDTPLFTTYRAQFVELAARNRLPAIWSNGIIVEAGGLMSYGTYIPALFRRAATYVDKILKGTKPADLPVEQPTKFELVINLKTAKQIGLRIPPNVLARADRVIK